MPTRPPKAYAPRVIKAQARPRKPAVGQSLYNTEEWKQKSRAFRKAHPYCQCEDHQGKPGAPKSACVDHVIAHRGNPALFWEERNWRALSWSCHSRATAAFDGGFGNARRSKSLRDNDLCTPAQPAKCPLL